MASVAEHPAPEPPAEQKPPRRFRLPVQIGLPLATAGRGAGLAVRPIAGTFSWLKAHRAKVLLYGGGLTVLVATPVLFIIVMTSGQPADETLFDPSAALAALDAQRFDEAREAADTLDTSTAERESIQAFILGAAAAVEAATLDDHVSKHKQLTTAVEKLERSHTLGFPPGRKMQGLLLLATGLVELGKNVAALSVIAEGIEAAEADSGHEPRVTEELSRLMAVAHVRAPNPDNPQALKYLDQILATKTLATAQREQALLDRAEVLLRLKKIDDCQAALSTLPPSVGDGPASLILKGRLAMVRADQQLGVSKPPENITATVDLAKSRYAPAVRFFQAALKADIEKQAPTRQASLLIGICRQRLGDTRGALAEYIHVEKKFGESPEGAVANLERAEIYRRQNDDEQASAAYRRAVTAAGNRESYSNPLLTLDAFQSRIAQAYRDYVSAKKFTEAIVISETLSPLLTRPQSLRIAARTREDWAAELMATAPGQAPGKVATQLRQARSLMRAAGSSYVQLAVLEEDPNREMDDRWAAARNFVAGQDYAKAVQQLTEYLNGPTRTRRQLALVALGESHLALGNPDAAIDALLECLERYPNDAATYRARLLAGKAYMERGDMSSAEEMFKQNLTGPLRPDSAEWRESLFTMGSLAFVVGSRLDAEARASELAGESKYAETMRKLEQSVAQFSVAAAKLDEALQRYPDDATALPSKYLLAESLRQTTKLPRAKLAKVTIEATRSALTRQIQEAADAALGHYAELVEQLNRRQETGTLSPLDRTMLRNAYFAQASVYYDLNQFDQAIAAYKAAANRYQNQPEALDAYFQLAACYRRLNRAQDARGTLEQAKVVLARLNANETAFKQTTSHTKQEWERLLDWMISL